MERKLLGAAELGNTDVQLLEVVWGHIVAPLVEARKVVVEAV